MKQEKNRIPWVTIALIFFCFSYFTCNWSGFWNPNEYSRIYLTRALIDTGSFTIDRYIAVRDTQDKAYYQGHYFTDKAPGSSFIASPVYAGIYLIEKYIGVGLSEAGIYYIIKVICISLPSVLFFVVLFKFWASITLNNSLRRALLISYALGTLAWPYSSLFFGHQLAGIALFLAFRVIFSSKQKPPKQKKAVFLCGLFCGLAFLIEYPTALLSCMILVYSMLVIKKPEALLYLILGGVLLIILAGRLEDVSSALKFKTEWILMTCIIIIYLGVILWRIPLLFFCLSGMMIPVGITFYYHWKCFGEILWFPYFFVTDPVCAVEHSYGISGVTFPDTLGELLRRGYILLQVLLSPFRGLFFFSPFLLFGIGGIVKMLKAPEWRREGLLFGALVISYVLFQSSFINWEGGWAMGPRHLVPLIPFLVTAVLYLVNRISPVDRINMAQFLVPLIIVSILITFIGMATFPHLPSIFKNPIYEFSWQFINSGLFGPTIMNWWGQEALLELAPLIIALGILVIILLRDLSWIYSTRPKVRFYFSLFCLGFACVLFLLYLLFSGLANKRLNQEEIAARKAKIQIIGSFLSRR